MTQYRSYIQSEADYKDHGFKNATRQIIKERYLEQYIKGIEELQEDRRNKGMYSVCYKIINIDTKETIYTLNI